MEWTKMVPVRLESWLTVVIFRNYRLHDMLTDQVWAVGERNVKDGAEILGLSNLDKC